jgi:hypothetical protein
MNKIYLFLLLIPFITISCKNEDEKLKLENDILRLKNKNEQLQLKIEKQTEANDFLHIEIEQLSISENYSESQNLDYYNSTIETTLDSIYQADTLDLKIYGNEYIFKRINKIDELNDVSLANTLGAIDEIIKAPGIKVFTIYNGEALPLEHCNSTGNIYIVFEPSQLGDDYSIFSIRTFNEPKLLEIERVMSGFDTKDYILKFEHGKYPRKIEEVSLNTLSFLNHENK